MFKFLLLNFGLAQGIPHVVERSVELSDLVGAVISFHGIGVVTDFESANSSRQRCERSRQSVRNDVYEKPSERCDGVFVGFQNSQSDRNLITDSNRNRPSKELLAAGVDDALSRGAAKFFD